MPPSWTVDGHEDFGFSDPAAIEEYERRSGVTPEGERKRLSEWDLRATDTMLEFGRGTGVLAVEASRLCRKVIAVDPSSAMLGRARARAAEAGITTISFVRAGFLTYRPPAEPVDVVAAIRSLHYLPDFWKVGALARIHAALKPGGRLHLSDLVYPFDPTDAERAIQTWIDVTADADAGFPRRSFEDHVRSEYSTYAWILEAILERVGFDIISATYDPRATYAAYTCTRRAR